VNNPSSVKDDIIVDEYAILIYELSREKTCSIKPGHKKAVAFPEIKAEQFRVIHQAKTPSGESISSPSKSVTTNTKAYQSSSLANAGKVNNP